MTEIREIEELIELMRKSGIAELSIERPDHKVSIKLGPEASADHPAASSRQEPDGEAPPADESASVTITAEVVPVVSPVVGVFHNAGMEEGRQLLHAGDQVQEGDLLAVVEAMKVPNEVRAPAGGIIAEIAAADGTAVDYGQRLFLIQPDPRSTANEDESAIGLA